MIKKISLITVILLFAAVAVAQESTNPIKLPAPQLDNPKTLMQALKNRKSTRTFSSKKLPQQVISNLLWAACGINRVDSGRRTAPSAVNWQEIDVYIATAEGLYRYDAQQHALIPILKQDIRAAAGKQTFVAQAALNLIYVADYSRMGGATAEEKNMYAAADTGFISQNVYLYCAAEGLATVVRALIDKEELAKIMKLPSYQKIILSQSVGYPE
jgi:SagB-type dehydrogenase family enzyme